MISAFVLPETTTTVCGFAYLSFKIVVAAGFPFSIFKTVLFLAANPENTCGGIWLKEYRGSSCGNPSNGAARTFRMASPTASSHKELSTTTDTLFMLPDEFDTYFCFEEFPSLHAVNNKAMMMTN